MKHINLIFTLSFLFLASCTTQHAITTKTTDIYGSGVIQKPVLVDMDVKDEKVSATINARGKKVSDDLKNQVLAEAIKKSNADVLVEPRFETDIKGRKMTVTVTGFPATYKNFHTIKQDEVELLKVAKVKQVETMDAIETKSKGGKLVLAVGLGIVLVVSLIIAIFPG
jgi:DNA/RNA endonuclease YhcR with UshA esterase domain